MALLQNLGPNKKIIAADTTSVYSYMGSREWEKENVVLSLERCHWRKKIPRINFAFQVCPGESNIKNNLGPTV